MTITAMDTNGDTVTKTVSIIHDHPPALTVLTPGYFVARPSLLSR